MPRDLPVGNGSLLVNVDFLMLAVIDTVMATAIEILQSGQRLSRNNIVFATS